MYITFSLVKPAYAGLMDIINKGQPAGYNIPTSANISDIISGGGKFNLITLVFVLVGFFFLFNIIGAGYDYVMSSGDPKKIATATSRLLNGFMGLGLAFFAFLIVNLITNVIGLGSLL
ncbi:MAG TPA: hypothetical protein VF837_02615 [Patescibacteria group bacterium]